MNEKRGACRPIEILMVEDNPGDADLTDDHTTARVFR